MKIYEDEAFMQFYQQCFCIIFIMEFIRMKVYHGILLCALYSFGYKKYQ